MEKDIIKIITFFDLFDYPLTLNEVWVYLDRKTSLNNIYNNLNNYPEIISDRNGFYFLSGREEIIEIRQKRHNYTNHKIKIAKRFSNLFRLLPFVKAIMLVNSIGSHNLRAGSDIDFFIITANKRIWLSRLFCAGLAKVLNSRPTVENKKNKICLSFYISENHYNLDDLMLPDEDPYFYYWIRSLVLLYNKNRTYENFLVANKLKEGEILVKEKMMNPLLNFLEKLARRWQLKIMPTELKEEMNNSDGVVIKEGVIKLYLHDRRREFLKKYNNKIHEVFKKSD